MRTSHKLLPLLIVLLIGNISFAQLATGQWKTHMSYVEGQKLARSDNKIYCVASGSLFSYGINDNAIETYSKVNGLSDVYINDIAYCNKTQTLVICYANGNIDLMSESGVTNIPDLKMKAMYGSKEINKVDIYDGIAYISADFGAMKLNIEKAEIAETYTFTYDESNPVNAVAILNNEIYAATNNGLYKAQLSSSNLQNFAEWDLINTIPKYTSIIDLVVFQSELIIASYYETENRKYIYRKTSATSWSQLTSMTAFNGFGKTDKVLAIANESNLLSFNENLKIQPTISSYNFSDLEYSSQNAIRCNAIIPQDLNTFYVADNFQGLVLYSSDTETESVYPNGPATNTIWDIDITQNILRTVHGKVEEDYYLTRTPGAVSTLKGNVWSFIDTRRGVPSHPWGSDMLSIASDPSDPNRYYVNGWHKGLMEFYNDEYVGRYTSSNSTLENVPEDPGALRTLGVTFDDNNNLWTSNSYVTKQLHVMTPEGKWYSFSPLNTSTAKIVEDITFTEQGILWVVTPYWGDGIIVYDHNNTFDDDSDDQSKYFSVYASSSTGSSELVSDNVYVIEKDNDGSLWVGTDNGIAIYYNPDNVFESSSNPVASRPNIARNDGTGLGDYLLANETINDIAVDGGNRKWLATASSGVYLVSSDGLDEIYHFTAENSPLLSNTVRVVEINNETGEVYFATENGLVSYQADATSGNADFSDLKVYPNPVREDFFGDLTITGLVDETTVKITDVSGNLVNETSSNGGTATWNCKNFYGERVGTGIYLIFCSDKDGKQSAMTKVMVVN